MSSIQIKTLERLMMVEAELKASNEKRDRMIELLEAIEAKPPHP